MTGDNTDTLISLSEKLSAVTHHHLLTRVPVKLDLDDWNYGQWDYFFVQLYESYDILFTLSDSLRARVVVAHPKSAKEAWSLISDIVKDNKRSRTNTLKTELRSIKLGDQSMESYFQKIDSIVNILTSLDARVNEEDVVHYALDGLPDTYNQVCGYMHWKDTFPDLKVARSLLIAEEMRLNSKVLTSPMDSFTPMVFVAGSSNNSRPSSTARGKPWKPCFNFAKGNCLYGDSCRYVHVANARVPNATSGFNKGRVTSENFTNELLNKLLAQLGKLGMNMSHTSTNTIAPTVSSSISLAQNSSVPIAYYASPSPTAPTSPSASPEFSMLAQVPLYYTAGPAQPDPYSSAWNIDTGASSHLNNSTTSLSIVLNSCMYSTVLVGDGHSIPVTNTSHSILPTPLKSLRLNNVLITPHIVKNLISLRQFVRDNDCTIEFDSFGFSVKDFMTRRVLLRCDSTRDLYPVTAPSPIPHAFLVSQHTWHQHLGHSRSDVLRRLVSNNVISCNKEKPPVLCHACQLGKHLLVRKSDVLSKFILFRNYVRTQFKCEIRAFQCDHGDEFDNQNLHDLFNTHGIQFHFSCPKTSQQNGKSKRMVCTLNNIIRTLLFQAKLPPTYWVEALHMAVYILNILPSNAINNEVPFTCLFGTSPNYSLLRTFGCLYYPHLYPNHKLEPRATPSLFLRHASNHRGYRCLDLTTNKIIISRHVTFDETTFPYGSTPSTTVPSYTFLDEPDTNPPSVSVSTFQPPVHEPTTPPTSPSHSAQSPITPIIDESANTV
ncbi:ribonuclease H-like domain-containing protein [Tanacetum coccineum]